MPGRKLRILLLRLRGKMGSDSEDASIRVFGLDQFGREVNVIREDAPDTGL
jgi:hypothetical protein